MSFDVALYAEDRVEYVPDFLGNRNAAETWVESGGEGPRAFFTVELLPMSSRDLNKLALKGFKGFGGNGDDAVRRSESIHARIFSKYVPTVSGLRLEGRDGKIEEPTTGRTLFDLSVGAAPYIREKLIENIIEALKDLSTAQEGDLKKLQSRHGTTRPDDEES